MRFLNYLVCFGFLISLNSLVFSALPNDYESYSAKEKQSLLWENSEISQWAELPALNNQAWSSLIGNIGALFTLKRSFDHNSDEMPSGRPKFIHTFGSVAKVELVPEEGGRFSGLYRSGAIGLARLSLAANPQANSYTPGMAIKLLIDGKSSLNLHVMDKLSGQGDDWNFFAHDFSNKIDQPDTFILKIIMRIFERARTPANDLPVNHLAMLEKDGSAVLNVVSPERLIFKPSVDVEGLILKGSREDFRLHLNSIPSNTCLYEVYGVYEGVELKLGRLLTRSQMISSQYADKDLFFQHKR